MYRWNIIQGRRDWISPGGNARLRCLLELPESRVLGLNEDLSYRILDSRSGLVKTAPAQRGQWGQVAISPDARLIAASDAFGGDGNKSIHIFDTKSGKEAFHITTQQTFINTLLFSPNGRILASGGGAVASVALIQQDTATCLPKDTGCSLLLYDLSTKKTVARLGSSLQPIFCLAFSPDNRSLATSAEDGVVTVWELRTGQVRAKLGAHTGVILTMAFSPDLRLIATACLKDPSIYLWDLHRRRRVHRLPGDGHDVTSLAFSRDAKLLASGSRSGVVVVWRLAGADKAGRSGRLSDR
jgi:WD40 repeat protein